MKFEELSTPNKDNIPEGHPAHYMEYEIKHNILPTKQEHDIEHEKMLKSWEFENLNANQLVYREENGNFYTDRFWHLALHHLYWKQNNMNMHLVEKFEENFYPLEETPMPTIDTNSVLPEY